MKALLLIVVLLAAFAADAGAKKGEGCRTYATQAGPVYKASAPHKEKFVCDPRPPGNSAKLAVIDRWACAGYCWKRHYENSPVLVVQGKVRKAGDCGSTVPGAVLDVWQASSEGSYGSLHAGENDGFCRAKITAGRDGAYDFETEIPGAYGTLSGLGPLGIDSPPFGPSHIHLAVYKPGYNMLVTQLFFAQDRDIVEYDWRPKKGRPALAPKEEDSVQLHLRKHPTRPGVLLAEKDVFLVSNASVTGSLESVALHAMCKGDTVDPPALCRPFLVSMLQWKVIVPLLALLFWLVYKAQAGIRAIVSFGGGTSTKVKQT
jgi:protocatechuate 3,4-dioxygenase beta subunit